VDWPAGTSTNSAVVGSTGWLGWLIILGVALLAVFRPPR
jgi:hypothetical protein